VADKLYVGNLPWEASEEEIQQMFQEYGEVQSVSIVTNPRTGRSRGFCFIEMENAEAAIDGLNEKEFGGRNLRVSQAREQNRDFKSERGGSNGSFEERFIENRIYVGNLPWDTSEDQLRDLFKQYGEVQSVNIITNRKTGRSKGYGFVEMENAEAAISELNEKEFGGRNLKVNQARERER
jgi:RNA recognition motif-containing protein